MPEPTTPTAVLGATLNSAMIEVYYPEATNYIASAANTPTSLLYTTEITNYIGSTVNTPISILLLSEYTNYLAGLMLSAFNVFFVNWRSHQKGRIIQLHPVELKQQSEMKQKVLTSGNEGLVELEISYLAPISIGQLVEVAFPVSGDYWSDNGMLYLTQSGRTIGNAASGASFSGYELKELFLRYHKNPTLALFSSNGTPVEKNVDPEVDWLNNRKLKLPLDLDSNKLIFTGARG